MKINSIQYFGSVTPLGHSLILGEKRTKNKQTNMMKSKKKKFGFRENIKNINDELKP